jgi:hypothetical protein
MTMLILVIFFSSSCLNKNSSKYINMEELPADTIAFLDLPEEIRDIYRPLMGVTFESMAARDSLESFCFYNFTKFEIRDSVDTIRGTHNFIFFQFLGEPKWFFFIGDYSLMIYRGISEPCIFFEDRFIYPLIHLSNYFKEDDARFLSINLSQYFKE